LLRFASTAPISALVRRSIEKHPSRNAMLGAGCTHSHQALSLPCGEASATTGEKLWSGWIDMSNISLAEFYIWIE